jgi:hypothetical protein
MIRRVALAQGVENQNDWAAWYRNVTSQEPNYSVLLEELASSPEERRAILHSYIEPTQEDIKEGRKVPTAAHRAIAELVHTGYITVIVTTNFDRLMENALRERGIEPTVVASVDALLGAEPITHSTCYILKIHGDYRDARILNTDEELRTYPAEYNALLDRILDEYGVIVCGWSGEWDHALRAAFLRAPNRRYSVFWAARGNLGNGATELVAHRRAHVIPIGDADSFFASLSERITTLQSTHRQNPLGIELLVSSTKRFLAKPEHRIQLNELFAEEVERLLEQLESPDLSPAVPWDQAVFRDRVRRYEALTEALACMAGVLGRWGDGSELPLVIDIIGGLSGQADKIGAGLILYLNIRSYPAALVYTAYALGTTRAGRWNILHQLFDTKVDRDQRDPIRSVESLFLSTWKGTRENAWKNIEGLERHKTPFSDHLFDLFGTWGKRFLGLTPHFEGLFELFEALGALAYLESADKGHLQEILAVPDGYAGMPVGRVGWNIEGTQKVLKQLQDNAMMASLFQAGFAKANKDFFELSIQNFRRLASRMQWMF